MEKRREREREVGREREGELPEEEDGDEEGDSPHLLLPWQ
jgi:hypothetical protein